MADAWWEAAPLANPAQASGTGFSGYIPGVPKPPAPKEPKTTWQTLTPEEATAAGLNPDVVWQRNSLGEIKTIGGKDTRAPAPLSDADKAQIREEAKQKIQLGASLLKRSREGYFTTGFGAGVGSMVGGTPAYGVKQDTETLKNAGALQRVIELSQKTGKNPLTPLSNSDFQALANSIANLDTSQPDEQYQRNIGTVIDIYKRAYQGAGGDPRDLDAFLNPNGRKPSVTVEPQDDGPRDTTPRAQGAVTPPELGEMTPDQKVAYAAFWRANKNPTPEQLNAFLPSIGLTPAPNAREIIAAVKSGAGYSTALDREQILRAEIEGQAKPGRVGGTDAGALIDQGRTLGLSDEAAGVGRGLSRLVQGRDPIEGYRLGRDAERLRIEDARQQLGYGGTALEVVGGLMSANPEGALAPFTTRRALIAGGAKAGAAGGALGGFGYGEGTEGSLAGAALGAAGGAAVGAGASALSSRLAPRGMAPDVADAAAAEDVRLIRPMVDERSRGKFGALESNPASQNIIRQGVADTTSDIERGVNRLGSGGATLEPGAAGERLQLSGNRYITRSRGIRDRLYTRAARLAGDVEFIPQNAIRQANEELAALEANPTTNAGEIAFIQGVRSDLSQPKTIQALRDLRTGLRGSIGPDLAMTQAEARAVRILDAATQDVVDNVPREASAAYRRADAFNRERAVMVQDIQKAILGKRNDPLDAQQAFKNIKALTAPGANGRRLAAVMRHLDPDERLDIAATVAQSLGRRGEDGNFSPALFLQQTSSDKFSPSALRVIFGPDGAQSVQNLRLLSRRLVDAQRDTSQGTKAGNIFRNSARSFVLALSGLGGYGAANTGGALMGATAAAGAMAAGAARKALSARALMSPRVSRWLAEAADVSTPAQAQQAVRRLGTIITREPALANELTPVHQMLQQSLAAPAGASPGDGGNDDEQR